MKEYDLTVCFAPDCENKSVGQLVFIGADDGTGPSSWYSEIVLCDSHAKPFEKEEGGVLPASVER